MDRKYNMQAIQCLLFGWWVMEVIPIILLTNMLLMNGQPSQYQTYLPDHVTDLLLFFYVKKKKIWKVLCFQSFLSFFPLEPDWKKKSEFNNRYNRKKSDYNWHFHMKPSKYLTRITKSELNILIQNVAACETNPWSFISCLPSTHQKYIYKDRG